MKNSDFEYIWTDKKRTFLGLPLSFTRYFLTNTKLITRAGFFKIIEDEINLYKVTDKKMELGFFQRIFKCGNIVIFSKDTDTPHKKIISVKNPYKVPYLIEENVNKELDKYKIRGRDMMGGLDNNEYEE